MRFTWFCCSGDGFEPVFDCVTTCWLFGIATSLMMTPSTTYSGEDNPLSVDTPRSFTWMPPPGAPEFCWIAAPGTLPWIALSTLGAGTRLRSPAPTVATAFGANRFSTPVACPVITTASRLKTSGSRVASTLFWSAATGTVRRL